MSKELAFNLIDQAAELQVPSMKFNWRGEPLLNPQLPKIIDHAKKSGEPMASVFNLVALHLTRQLSKCFYNADIAATSAGLSGG